MSLAYEVFGERILEMQKADVIKLIKSSPLIVDYRKDEALKDWAAAIGQELTADDFAALHEGE